MKIKTNKILNKPLITLSLIILLGIISYCVYTNVQKSDNSNANTPSPAKQESSDKLQAERLSSDPATKTQAPNADKPATPNEASGDQGKRLVPMTASTDSSSGYVYIRGGVNYPVSNGSCYALLTGPSGQSLRKDTSVLASPASADCKTISIGVDELAQGKWSFKLYYVSDNYRGVSNEITFTR